MKLLARQKLTLTMYLNNSENKSFITEGNINSQPPPEKEL